MICPKCGSNKIATTLDVFMARYVCGDCGYGWTEYNYTLIIGVIIVGVVILWLVSKFARRKK